MSSSLVGLPFGPGAGVGLLDQSVEVLAEAVLGAVDAAPVGVLVVSGPSATAAVVHGSPTAKRMFGCPPNQLVGSRADSLLPGLCWDSTEADQERPLARTASNVETVITKPDGTTLPVEVSCATASRDGEEVVTMLLLDISERKRAEAALRRSEARFKRLIESAPEGVLIVDERAVLYANPIVAQLLGVQPVGDLIGRDPRTFLHPDDVEKFDCTIRAILHESGQLQPSEFRLPRPGGRLLILEWSSIAMEYEGRPALLSLARDVTGRKHIESQLLQADRLSALGMLAGGMAHAINNPLTYVLLNLDDVSRRLPEVTSGRSPLSEALARLKEAHQGAERIARTVRQMRTFSRADDRVRGPVDLARVLDAVVAMVGNELRHRARLVTELADVPPVRASSARLEHVFLNLLVHVARALPEGDTDGEVAIILKSEPPDQVVVEVSDYGPGIEPAILERVFDPFLGGRDSAERVGLGLSLCHSIVTDLGGEITAESRPEGGTCYRISLPADQNAWQQPPHSGRLGPPRPPPITRRARVMVVDDDPGVASALRLMLEDDHDVTSVASGREALRRLVRDGAYDIVFCDLMMPELSGKDLFEALQLNCPGREQRLVFMTGGAFTPEAARFLKQVPNARIEKPFDMDSVRVLLQYATERAP
jgi:two-component system cell cycle sensor histidine kinase/response regulator CckA